jgi:hypothetical protein
MMSSQNLKPPFDIFLLKDDEDGMPLTSALEAWQHDAVTSVFP